MFNKKQFEIMWSKSPDCADDTTLYKSKGQRLNLGKMSKQEVYDVENQSTFITGEASIILIDDVISLWLLLLFMSLLGY